MTENSSKAHDHSRCRQVRDEASEYLEEGLPAERRDLLRTHMARCAPCLAFGDSLRSTLDLIRGLPPQKAPPSLHRAVQQHTQLDNGKA